MLLTLITLTKKTWKEKKNLKNFTPFIISYGIVTKKVYSREKKINLSLNLISAILVVTGSIVGGATMNPIILGTISGAGVILKTAMELKNLQKKIENVNVAFTSYAKILVDLRNFLRGEEWEKEIYLQKLKTLDDMVIEMGLNREKYLEKYKKEF